MAPFGQWVAQRPQPVHFSLSMMGITSPFRENIPSSSRRVMLSLDLKECNLSLFLPVQVFALHLH